MFSRVLMPSDDAYKNKKKKSSDRFTRHPTMRIYDLLNVRDETLFFSSSSFFFSGSSPSVRHHFLSIFLPYYAIGIYRNKTSNSYFIQQCSRLEAVSNRFSINFRYPHMLFFSLFFFSYIKWLFQDLISKLNERIIFCSIEIKLGNLAKERNINLHNECRHKKKGYKNRLGNKVLL